RRRLSHRRRHRRRNRPGGCHRGEDKSHQGRFRRDLCAASDGGGRTGDDAHADGKVCEGSGGGVGETKSGQVNSDKTSTISSTVWLELPLVLPPTIGRALPRWSEFPLSEAEMGQGLMRARCPATRLDSAAASNPSPL